MAELTAPYTNLMITPRRGPSVCEICFNLTGGYERCYACTKNRSHLDAFLPISYSVGGEQLHHVLRSYKRLDQEIGERFCRDLAAILWRFLERHEACLARAAGVPSFDVVTTVPSTDPRRQLTKIVGQLVRPTASRHSALLRRSPVQMDAHCFDAGRFEQTRPIAPASILLIDDTWTTGASAQSAAAALKQAGAHTVAAVAVGRYLNRDYRDNRRRLHAVQTSFDWARCALCRSFD